MQGAFVYKGTELDLFSHANHWKAYWGSLVRPFLGNRILDVGAGIGTTAKLLCNGRESLWLALEPDRHFAERIQNNLITGRLPRSCEVQNGTIETLNSNESFDTVLYIDVLEHIQNDRKELELAARRMQWGGRLIVLAPAHQNLFTAFDDAVGHHRRYNREAVLALTPEATRLHSVRYLDSVGLIASLGNRLFLRSSMPTRRQVRLWDDWMVPMSRLLDPLIGYRLGKSILAVWCKDADQS